MTWWPSARRASFVLAAVLIVCFGARMGWMLHLRADAPELTHSPDTPSYVGAAHTARGGPVAFSRFAGSSQPLFVRTPGYPLFLAGAFAVTDENRPRRSPSRWWCSVATAWLTFVIAASLWGEMAGVFAALVNVLDPTQFRAVGHDPDGDAGGVRAPVLRRRRVPPRDPEATTPPLGGGPGAHAGGGDPRPSDDVLPADPGGVAARDLLLADGRVRNVDIALVVAFLVPVVVLVGGWQVRNEREVDSFRFSAIDAYNIYAYRAAGVLAIEHGTSVARRSAAVSSRRPDLGRARRRSAATSTACSTMASTSSSTTRSPRRGRRPRAS